MELTVFTGDIIICRMESILLKELEKNDAEAVRTLVNICNDADGTAYDPALDGDFFYLIRNEEPEECGVKESLLAVLSGYRAGATIEGQTVLELEAFVHPAVRNLGLFTLCLDSLRDDFRDYRCRLIIKARKDLSGLCPDTEKALSALNAFHDEDELLMEKQLTRKIRNPGDTLCSRFGEVHFTPYSRDTLYLYGLLVYDRYLRQGHAREMLEKAEAMPDGSYAKILLQVSSGNHAALHLYQKAGYKTTEKNCYYLLP